MSQLTQSMIDDRATLLARSEKRDKSQVIGGIVQHLIGDLPPPQLMVDNGGAAAADVKSPSVSSIACDIRRDLYTKLRDIQGKKQEVCVVAAGGVSITVILNYGIFRIRVCYRVVSIFCLLFTAIGKGDWARRHACWSTACFSVCLAQN